jgi:hypothetical protein
MLHSALAIESRFLAPLGMTTKSKNLKTKAKTKNKNEPKIKNEGKTEA